MLDFDLNNNVKKEEKPQYSAQDLFDDIIHHFAHVTFSIGIAEEFARDQAISRGLSEEKGIQLLDDLIDREILHSYGVGNRYLQVPRKPQTAIRNGDYQPVSTSQPATQVRIPPPYLKRTQK